MTTEEKILKEIQDLKKILANLLGLEANAGQDIFSTEALNSAAKQFREMSTQRGEWIEAKDFSKYINTAPYNAGKFIREEFGFTSFYKKGYSYFYNKQDIITLGKELKERNINLSRYIELRSDQEIFEKCITSVRSRNSKKPPRPFHIPDDLSDIITTPAKRPELSVMQMELQKLKDEFLEKKLDEYIDIYKNNYAAVKSIYYIKKYLEPTKRRRFSRWCDEFNTVNRIIKEITNKK
jgi:hypothetical protein